MKRWLAYLGVATTRFLSKRTVTLVAALSLALSAALLMGVSSARASSSDCPDKNWCIWTTTFYGQNGGYMYEFDNNYNGTNNWYGIYFYSVGESVANRRQNKVFFSYDVPPPNPAPNHKDCMIPGGGRGNLSTWYYPSGFMEWNAELSIDLIYDGTNCS